MEFRRVLFRSKNKMIDLNVGDTFISNHTLSLEEIKAKQIEDQKTFDNLAKGYHLYD